MNYSQAHSVIRHRLRGGVMLVASIVLLVAGNVFVSAQESPAGIAGRLGGAVPTALPAASSSMGGA